MRGPQLAIALVIACLGLGLGVATSIAPAALALEPPPDRVEGQRVYDDGLLGDANVTTATTLTEMVSNLHDLDVYVVAHRRDGVIDDPDEQATETAASIIDAWGLDSAVVLAVEAAPDDCNGGIGIATSGGNPADALGAGRIVNDEVRGLLDACLPSSATLESLFNIVTALSAGFGTPEPEVSTGPPYPDPEIDRAVYDNASVFSPEAIASAESTIDAIEARTGAEVVVYSQVVDYGITTEEADRHAQALMDQWGVGRKGFDDGLVILFDLDPSLEHGQVILYGGPGYRAAYLDNAAKQRIIDEDMLPHLREGDLEGALRVALQRVDENATPEHAAQLQLARQVDAAVGLIGAPVILLTLIGSSVFAWLRYGRDPVYLDDPSIHMAGPPRDLTPASATFVLAGGPSRRSLTAAMLDLASRGEVSFRPESALLGLKKKVGIQVRPGVSDAVEEARRNRNRVRPLGPAEDVARRELFEIADRSGYIEPDELLKFGTAVPKFNQTLESEVIRAGWFREKPSKATTRWVLRGGSALVLGVIALVAGLNLPSAGLTLIGGAGIAGGIVLIILSRWMPAVSIPGSMIRAMLAAYRRTLEKTMAQSRSMDEVVEKARLDWLDTPDQAVVWGTALGLEKEIEGVLERSFDDVTNGQATVGSTYFPVWYGGGTGDAHGFAAGGGGLLSSSGIPDIGGMMGALSTIGNSPGGSSSGGGGFGGGGSGGGGGGSGGGF